MQLLCDPAIRPVETCSTDTPAYTWNIISVTLSRIAKGWNDPKCLSARAMINHNGTFTQWNTLQLYKEWWSSVYSDWERAPGYIVKWKKARCKTVYISICSILPFLKKWIYWYKFTYHKVHLWQFNGFLYIYRVCNHHHHLTW